ncbi:MAG: hypothetical protein ABI131_05945 [Nostocoides sp.]
MTDPRGVRATRPRAVLEAARTAVAQAQDVVLARVGAVRDRPKGPVDPTGWATGELRAWLEAGHRRLVPPLRLGRDVVTMINRLSGTMPVEGALLARAITDLAPPVGIPADPALVDVITRYLPGSIDAYAAQSRAHQARSAGEQLIGQVRLLRAAAEGIARADAEHNERELRIQADFLRERFAHLSPNQLDLPRTGPVVVPIPALPASTPSSAKVATPTGRVFLRAAHSPVVLFSSAAPATWDLTVRLAVPKGVPVRLGCIIDTSAGGTTFAHKTARRVLGGRRATGFTTPQTDVVLPVTQAGLRRVIIYARSAERGHPVDAVLFLRDRSGSQAELETLLTQHRGAATTVIASAYETTDGLLMRNESLVFPDLRSAARGFGFDDVAWLDAQTPIV